MSKYISKTGVTFEVINHFELTGYYECKSSYNPKGDGMVMIDEKFFKTLEKVKTITLKVLKSVNNDEIALFITAENSNALYWELRKFVCNNTARKMVAGHESKSLQYLFLDPNGKLRGKFMKP